MDNPDNRLAEWFIFYITGLLFFTVGAITTLGIDWYQGLVVPTWTPSIPTTVVIWCVVFIGMALSAARMWNNGYHAGLSWYGVNVLLLLSWNYLFFGAHAFGLSCIAASLVLLSVFQLIIINWKRARKTMWLLTPYLLWMLFATPISYFIYQLN